MESKGIAFQAIPIREHPPSIADLKHMLREYGGDMKRLFNTSGQDYRKMNLKEKLADLSQADALQLLHENGNLVKRPFALSKEWALVGFREEEWEEKIG